MLSVRAERIKVFAVGVVHFKDSEGLNLTGFNAVGTINKEVHSKSPYKVHTERCGVMVQIPIW
jgi:hypothetical protein